MRRQDNGGRPRPRCHRRPCHRAPGRPWSAGRRSRRAAGLHSHGGRVQWGFGCGDAAPGIKHAGGATSPAARRAGAVMDSTGHPTVAPTPRRPGMCNAHRRAGGRARPCAAPRESREPQSAPQRPQSAAGAHRHCTTRWPARSRCTGPGRAGGRQGRQAAVGRGWHPQQGAGRLYDTAAVAKPSSSAAPGASLKRRWVPQQAVDLVSGRQVHHGVQVGQVDDIQDDGACGQANVGQGGNNVGRRGGGGGGLESLSEAPA